MGILCARVANKAAGNESVVEVIHFVWNETFPECSSCCSEELEVTMATTLLFTSSLKDYCTFYLIASSHPL